MASKTVWIVGGLVVAIGVVAYVAFKPGPANTDAAGTIVEAKRARTDGTNSFNPSPTASTSAEENAKGTDERAKQAEVGKQAELGKGELGKGELGKGELGKGELGKGELGKGELGKGELGKGELGKGELGKGELGKGELGKGELGKGELGKPVDDAK
jgi:hypothetical protein